MPVPADPCLPQSSRGRCPPGTSWQLREPITKEEGHTPLWGSGVCSQGPVHVCKNLGGTTARAFVWTQARSVSQARGTKTWGPSDIGGVRVRTAAGPVADPQNQSRGEQDKVARGHQEPRQLPVSAPGPGFTKDVLQDLRPQGPAVTPRKPTRGAPLCRQQAAGALGVGPIPCTEAQRWRGGAGGLWAWRQTASSDF